MSELVHRVLCVGIALFATATLSSTTALAENGATSSAAAEALFENAVKLMETEDFSAACEKFKASQELDPALGTLLRLADCYDRDGKTASAWATFKEVSSLAEQRGQGDRKRMADERVTDLETRLSRLELRVAVKEPPKGFEIQLNGVTVPKASYNAPLPVDPGPQEVRALAPGHEPWTGSIDVPKGPADAGLDVPALKPAPKKAASDSTDAQARESDGSTQRVIGYVMGGVGIASLAVSGGLAYHAHSLREQSLDECRSDDSNACTPEGVELRDDALKFATAANYPFFIGAGLLVGGVTLVLTAPSSEPKRAGVPRFTASVDPISRRVGVRMETPW
jgi:serine/threonine-protein kinase